MFQQRSVSGCTFTNSFQLGFNFPARVARVRWTRSNLVTAFDLGLFAGYEAVLSTLVMASVLDVTTHRFNA